MNIALIAHDAKKELLVQFCIAYKGILAKHNLSATNTTHRIDPATVKAEVIAAGFVFDGESKVLANPADKGDLKVFDPSLRGKTNQFVYRFRKPK